MRILICIFVACLALYAYIDKQNNLTELRIAIPALEKEVREVQIENRRLQYELDQLKSPENLFKLSNRPEFSHLHYPVENEVIILEEKNHG